MRAPALRDGQGARRESVVLQQVGERRDEAGGRGDARVAPRAALDEVQEQCRAKLDGSLLTAAPSSGQSGACARTRERAEVIHWGDIDPGFHAPSLRRQVHLVRKEGRDVSS